MTLADLFRFYLGDADAILRLAADPWTLAVGGLLVLSAGLARHHDTHDLRKQWWRLLIPFAASTLAAGGLFLVVVLMKRGGADALAVGRGLLGLFWLTAPFAWLYGLSFERLWPAARAATARRVALATVAAARVALMTRCVGVLLDYPWWSALAVVVAFALPAALLAVGVALAVLRRPDEVVMPRQLTAAPAAVDGVVRVVDHMGGVPANFPNHDPVSPPHQFSPEPLQESGVGIAFGCWAVFLLGAAAFALPYFLGPPRWPADAVAVPVGPPGADVWVAVGLAILFWVPWLVLHQPAQRRRTMCISQLRHGPVTEAVCDLADHVPGDFPPHWDPAAALAQPVFAPRLLQAAQVAADLPAGHWVRVAILRALGHLLPVWLDSLDLWFPNGDRMPAEQLRALADLIALLRRLPEGQELVRPYEDYLVELCAYTQQRDPPRAELLQDLLTLALKRRPAG